MATHYARNSISAIKTPKSYFKNDDRAKVSYHFSQRLRNTSPKSCHMLIYNYTLFMEPSQRLHKKPKIIRFIVDSFFLFRHSRKNFSEV